MRGNPNPTCEKSCKFQYSNEFATTLAYNNVYDKHGNKVSEDPNTYSGAVDCLECGKHWTYISKYGVTKFEEWQAHTKAKNG